MTGTVRERRGVERVARRWLGLPLASLLLASGGCRAQAQAVSEPYPVRVDRVSRGARGNNAFPQSAVDRALAAGFSSNPRFRLAKPGEQALHGTFWFDDQPAADGGRAIELALQVDAPPDLRAALGEGDLEAFVSLEREAPVVDDLSGDLTLGLELAVSVLDARVALARGERHRIASLIQAEDPELVLLALEWTRNADAEDFADDVARLLDHEDPRVASAAVETLGTIGSSRHVPAILQHLRLADAGHAYRAYDALGALGGPEARAFLRFAARNEDEPERRVAAERALVQAAKAGPAGIERDDPAKGHGWGETARAAEDGAGKYIQREPSVRGHRQ